jgi:DNA-binding GntR family transcriptional regulator
MSPILPIRLLIICAISAIYGETMKRTSPSISRDPSEHETELPEQIAGVIAAIEVDIIRGRILPSARLIEDHLMEDYAAKRHTIRDALVELQRLGIVVKPRYRGAELRRFSARELADLYAVRVVLHRAAVAAIQFPVAPARLEQLEVALQAHALSAMSGDLISIHRTNMTFHRALYGLCDNPYLSESIRLHDWLSFPARAYAVADTDALKLACDEHALMVTALKTSDRATLDRLSVAHMERARQIYAAKFVKI